MARKTYRKSLAAALFFAALPVFTVIPKPAFAIPVVDAGTHTILNTFLPQIVTALNEMTAQQTITNQHLETLIQAIGAPGAFTGGTSTLQDFTLDGSAFGSIVPEAQDLPNPGAQTLPDFTQINAMKQQLTNTYSMINQVSSALKDGEKPTPQTFQQIMAIKTNIEKMQRSRAEAAYSFSLYSLQTGQEAKAAEQTLKSAARSTPSLRSDTKALNSSVITMLERINHLIAAISTQNANDAAQDVGSLPWLPSEASRKPDPIDASRLPEQLIRKEE